MRPREFGNSGVHVSPVSLGCWVFGVDWWGHRTQDDCNRMCSFALERGVTFFDNGDAYGNGRAETLFGNWLKTLPAASRQKVQVGGKFGYDFYIDPGTPGSHKERRQDFSPAFMRTALDRSLARLGVDVIDVYLAHNIKMPHFSDDLFAELDKVRDEGKIRCWGVSLGPAIGWREEGFEAMVRHDAKAVQTVYNYLEQHPGRELVETARSCKAGILARVQDNSGVLKDVIKADTKLSQDDHRKFRDLAWRVYGPQKVDRIRPVADKHGMTVHQLACKWLLQHAEELTSITATLLDEKEIDDVVTAAEMPDLDTADLREMRRLYDANFDLPDEGRACDLKSSIAPGGKTPSEYVAPPTMLA